jgi:hypothetical protein
MDGIDNRFTYHAPTPEQVPLYENIRATAKRFADDLNVWCPDSREKSLAITALEESVFWANAAIARNPR